MKQIALDIGLASAPLFANFFAGPNEAALKHLQLWAGNSLRSPVPTYLWGEPGSGKTHLLKAFGGELCAQGASVGWLDASLLEPPPFNERWVAVLLDDCHLYTAVQQQAAFNWFVNALSSGDGQPRCVLAAGALPPADLKLRDDLRSRLGWGHVLALQPLSEAQSRGALRREADRRGLFLSDEVIDHLLHRHARDLKHLMDQLDRLDEFALIHKRAITVPLLRQMLMETHDNSLTGDTP